MGSIGIMQMVKCITQKAEEKDAILTVPQLPGIKLKVLKKQHFIVCKT